MTLSISSSGSPTLSAASQATSHDMMQKVGSFSKRLKDRFDTASLIEVDTAYDSENEDILTTSGDADSAIGLFDIVKRDFRIKTAVITNKAEYTMVASKKNKINFIQDMKNKVGIAIEYKNRGLEEMQNKDLKLATRFFHLALLHIKGLDPDEGVSWSLEFETIDKDKLPLRVMPVELKEIKEGVEIDCYLGLAGCLQHRERVPYRRIKDYCLRVLNFRDDHIPALTKCGMACYYTREYELCRFYMQTAKDLSSEPMDPEIRKYLRMVENQLTKMRKK